MYSDFLAHQYTYAASDTHLQTWHQGIPWYGFWAVLITDIQWLACLETARTHLQSFLLPDYARQAHITLSAAGLIHPRHFSTRHYEQQKQALTDAATDSFQIVAGQLNSFQSAPYLVIDDPSQQLISLRRTLGAITADDEPPDYHPHITLGLYQDRFPCKQLVTHFESISLPTLAPLQVSEIAFCRYQSCQLQGRFQIVDRFDLTLEST
jgi:2'-5' RNA ligase